MGYIVLIADIVSSKDIESRRDLQLKISDVLDELNSKKNRYLVSPYTITLGDEFQAVFSRADNVFSEVIQILYAIYPVKVRLSFGIGDIVTPINAERAIGMDGSAFYQARKGIEALKKSNYLFSIKGLRESPVNLIPYILQHISHSINQWRKNRLFILSLMFEKISIGEIAKKVKITDKAVYKNIEAGDIRVIIKLFQEITTMMNLSLVGK